MAVGGAVFDVGVQTFEAVHTELSVSTAINRP